MMDESSSITWEDYDKEKQFLIDVIQNLNVNPNYTRVALITYSDKAKLRFDLDDMETEKLMVDKISTMPRYPGNTNTGGALSLVRNRVFDVRFGSRIGQKVGEETIPQIGVVITDGRSQRTDYTAEQAKATRHLGVALIVVAVGKDIDQNELDSIATSSEFILPVVDFSALHSIVEDLGAKVCEGEQTKQILTSAILSLIDHSTNSGFV